jgi:glycolate oxidase FAD binding subunit
MNDISKELVDHVSQARADNTPLNIIGGGSKTFFGREPQGQTLSVAKHQGIVSYQPVELVMTALAGTSITNIENVLAEQGQMLAFEPPSFAGKATIGGTLACNLSGPARPWAGSVRDAVLGLKLINGKSEHLNFGGQVLKNVAGYDVSRMQAGSMGCLGVITQVSLKVMPKPQSSLTLVQEMDAQQAIKQMNLLAARAKPLTAACWLNNKLYLRLSGAQSAVDGTVNSWAGDILENDQVFWQALKEQQLDFFSGSEPLWRFSVNANAKHFLPEQNWLIDWGGSQRWLRGEHDVQSLETLAESCHGQVNLFRGGNRTNEVYHRQSAALKTIHQRLKLSFDPENIFNPGRLYSWL